MSKPKKVLVVCLAVVGIGVAAVVASDAWAQHSGGPSWRHWMHRGSNPQGQPAQGERPLARLIHERLAQFFALKADLGLTDEQKNSVHQILRNHREELLPLVKAVVAKHKALRNAVLADEPSQETIRAASEQLGTAIGDVAVVASGVVGEIKGVLTPEQLQKLRDFHAQRDLNVEEFLQHLGSE
jgi:hypothetical protein